MISMSKIRSVAGVLRTLGHMAKEDFDEMDHKLFRLAVGIGSFVVMGLFWLFFLKSIMPF